MRWIIIVSVMCLFVVKQTRYLTRVNAARDKRVQHFSLSLGFAKRSAFVHPHLLHSRVIMQRIFIIFRFFCVPSRQPRAPG